MTPSWLAVAAGGVYVVWAVMRLRRKSGAKPQMSAMQKAEAWRRCKKAGVCPLCGGRLSEDCLRIRQCLSCETTYPRD